MAGKSRISQKRKVDRVAKVENSIIPYIIEESKKKHFPTRREIENSFHTKVIESGGISGLYQKAGVEYQPKINQGIKYEKAKSLTSILLELLPAMDIKVTKVRSVYDRGADILGLDLNNRNVGIEVKAYCWFEAIKNRNIKQVNRFIENENLDYCYLITTTNRIQTSSESGSKIKIILYDELSKLCNQDQIEILKGIRSKSVNQESGWKEDKRKQIVEFARKTTAMGKKLTIEEINRELKVDFRSYFKNILELYKIAGIELPSRLWGGLRSNQKLDPAIEERLLSYLQSEIKKGRYVNGIELGKKFGTSHIWNFVSTRRLYEKIGIPPYYWRKNKLKSDKPN